MNLSKEELVRESLKHHVGILDRMIGQHDSDLADLEEAGVRDPDAGTVTLIISVMELLEKSPLTMATLLALAVNRLTNIGPIPKVPVTP